LMKIQNHREFPEFDHRAAPSRQREQHRRVGRRRACQGSFPEARHQEKGEISGENYTTADSLNRISTLGVAARSWKNRRRADVKPFGQPLQALEPVCRRTANNAERTLTAVMAAPHPGLWEKSAASIGSNGSTPSGDFSEIEATIHRLCDARSKENRRNLLPAENYFAFVSNLGHALESRRIQYDNLTFDDQWMTIIDVTICKEVLDAKSQWKKNPFSGEGGSFA
jgi:hypothetical protein